MTVPALVLATVSSTTPRSRRLDPHRHRLGLAQIGPGQGASGGEAEDESEAGQGAHGLGLVGRLGADCSAPLARRMP